jgi:hypothetical protein
VAARLFGVRVGRRLRRRRPAGLSTFGEAFGTCPTQSTRSRSGCWASAERPRPGASWSSIATSCSDRAAAPPSRTESRAERARE